MKVQKRNSRIQSVGHQPNTSGNNFYTSGLNLTQEQTQLSKFKITSPLKAIKQDPNYSFSEGPSFFNQKTVEERAKLKLPHYKPSTSLAEENLVKNFNKFTKLDSINLPTNQPQRIELPLFFNTPNRTQQLRSQSFQKSGKQSIQNAEFIRAKRRLQDYKMLGFACRRAKKTRDEGRSYYSQGVLCDNMGKTKEAIIHYKKFWAVCKEIGDTHGEALAYNCIGVDYQLLGEQQDPKYFEEAIVYHKKHQELADINGKFLSIINLGLCYDKMGNYEESMIQYQNALRHSIKMANLVGQTIAIGNISKIGTQGLHADKEKMKIFVEKYMKLSSELRDKNGEVNAHIKLGQLDIQNHDYVQGKEQFEKALELAQVNGDQNTFSYSKCGYAISNVENNIASYIQDYKNKFEQHEREQKTKSNSQYSSNQV